MPSPRDEVQNMINNNPVIVFSTTNCPFCDHTRDTLNQLRAKYITLELDEIPNGADMLEVLREMTGSGAVPKIYINQRHIGGNDNLQETHAKKELEPLLREANAL